MNKNILPPFIGVFASWLVIWQLHSYLFVDACLDKGGHFEYSTGQCLLDNGAVQGDVLTAAMLVLYFIVGFIVALCVAMGVRKIIS